MTDARTDPDLDLMMGRNRGNWIRLRTMILLRWAAIVGQLAAIFVATRFYHLQLEIGLCLLVVGIAVMGNLVAMFIFPETKRLSEIENFAMVLFDLLQLSLLLFLTGGLHNPFAILLVGPVTVAATAMTPRSILLMNAVAIAIVSLLVVYHLPLRSQLGYDLRMPGIFVFGNWAAIVIALVFLSVLSNRVTSEMHAMADALTATQMALAREQKLTDLGGVVAAYAHELGTPLATIKLASAELMEELDDRPDLAEDAALIRTQANRCRDILRSMGRAGKDDLHLRQAPLMQVIREAAEPHIDRGKEIRFEENPDPDLLGAQPSILRRPEMIHGIRNLVQNAVDFSRSRVWVEAIWTADRITLRIVDDGPGYPPQVLGRIGDPFMARRRTPRDKSRPGYEGMGLGLFIAKTLLERTGAELSFANGSDPFLDASERAERSGAIVEVSWPRDRIDARQGPNAVPLGENQLIAT